ELSDRPATIILIAELDRTRLPVPTSQNVLRYYWRQLFHAHVQMDLEEKWDGLPIRPPDVRRRIAQLGVAEFAEARLVLTQDDLLFDPDDVREVYIEFVATYLELRRFAPDLLAVTFPMLAGRDDIEALLAEDVNAEALFERTRPQAQMPPIPE